MSCIKFLRSGTSGTDIVPVYVWTLTRALSFLLRIRRRCNRNRSGYCVGLDEKHRFIACFIAHKVPREICADNVASVFILFFIFFRTKCTELTIWLISGTLTESGLNILNNSRPRNCLLSENETTTWLQMTYIGIVRKLNSIERLRTFKRFQGESLWKSNRIEFFGTTSHLYN